MLLPINIKTGSSHPSAVSSRKHCSEGHCGMPSSPIHHQVSFLVSRPTILVSLLSSFCDNSHTPNLPPWQVTREPKPKYIQICLKQCDSNVTRIVQSWLTQSSAAQKHHPLTGQSQFQLDSSLLLPLNYLFFKTIMNLTALVRPEPLTSFEWKNTNVKS